MTSKSPWWCWRGFTSLVFLLGLTSCVGLPDGIEPVDDFALEPYLGTWYEIARLDHSFERGLDRVTATYSRREGGGVKVINRGLNTETGEWQEAEGKAFFVEDEATGYFKVSFFGPFYGAYVIFELDDNYQYAFITGNDRSYLWLLSRTPQITPELKQHFLERVKGLGFSTDELIFLQHPQAIKNP